MVYSENADSSPTKRMSNLNLENVSKSPKKRQRMVFSSSEERRKMVVLSSDASEQPSVDTPVLRDDSDLDTDNEDG